jgi:hypothetical protein
MGGISFFWGVRVPVVPFGKAKSRLNKKVTLWQKPCEGTPILLRSFKDS